jgi:hypothetical protein
LIRNARGLTLGVIVLVPSEIPIPLNKLCSFSFANKKMNKAINKEGSFPKELMEFKGFIKISPTLKCESRAISFLGGTA